MTARVRVVVLNHNGGDTTLECLRRLGATDWAADALEIVLVDNGSTDGVAARARRDHPDVQVVESAVNRGFAGGCNLALRDRAGTDHFALVNNDVLVDPGWLRPLVAALEANSGVGAAGPKIRFSEPMLEVRIRAVPTWRPGRGDRRDLGVRLSGVRVDGLDRWTLSRLVRGFWGLEPGHGEERDYQWTGAEAVLRVPVATAPVSRTCELRLSAARPTSVELTSGGGVARHRIDTDPAWYPVELAGEPFEVINNAGSELVEDGYGADRGFLERDVGQYDREEDVFAWCGAAVLLRGEYLADVGLFDERLFLYYEDLELSLRGASRGWRYRYVPRSVVRHVHSATTVEGSALAQHYNERNRLLVVTRYQPSAAAFRAVVRYWLVTVSYARRDVISRWLRGEPARPEIVRRRMRAFVSYLRLARSMIRDRRAI
jgi:GT2 family glycosyltransferase